MIRQYEDFEVIITAEKEQLYADLGAVPDGRRLAQPVPIAMPDDGAAWAEACQGHKSEAELAELGNRLFEALITGEIASEWNARLSQVRRHANVGLRLRFNIQAGALDRVPLELLCTRIAPLHEFLALDALTPIVRSPAYSGFAHERPIRLPLRILAVIAPSSPPATADPLAEQASLEDALGDLIESGKLMIDYLGLPGGAGADYDTLYQTLVQTNHPYDVVHFIGSGDGPAVQGAEPVSSLVSVGAESGRGVRISDLAGILTYTGVRIAVLQTCDSASDGVLRASQDMARQFVAKGLPAVLTAQCPMSKDVATRFCRQFYSAWLADSDLPVEYAVAAARQSIYRQFSAQTLSWWSPVLFAHRQSAKALKVRVDRLPFRVHLKRGGILMQRGQIDQAVAEFEQAHTIAADEVSHFLARALVTRAQALEEKGDEDGALAACERALEVFPVERIAQEIKISIWTRRGDEALARDDLDGALAAYEQTGNRLKVDEVEARKQKKQDARKVNQDRNNVTLDTTVVKSHLRAGEEYIKASEWQAAIIEFNQGLEFYHQYGQPNGLPGRSGEQFRDLRMGQLYAQGALLLSERQWQAAVGAFKALQQFDSIYLDTDIAAQLEQAQLEQRRERKYNYLLTLVEQEDWAGVLRLAADLDPSYRMPGSKPVSDIAKHALYAWGKELEADDPWRAYYLFHDLYTQDPHYRDVAELCATVAFQNGTRPDVPMSWEQQVDWLEKVVEIDPHHRTGRTRQLLDRARHRRAEELLKENNPAAIAQLERIGSNYNQWVEVRQVLASMYYRLLQEGRYLRTERANLDAEAEARSRLGIERWEKGDWQGAVEQLADIPPEARVFPSMLALAQTYVALGHREREARQWENAIQWWDKALAISPGLAGTLRWRIREVNARFWVKRHKWATGMIAAVFVILVALIVIVQIRRTPAIPALSETTTPTPVSTGTPSTPLVTSPTATMFILIPTPTSTSTPGPATDTPLPTFTPTPSPTFTPTPSPSPIPVVVSPHLWEPTAGQEVSSDVTFEWRGSLQGNQTFRVILRHVSTSEGFESPDLTTSTWATTLPGDKYGEYRWQVVIVQGNAIVARSAEEWHFWFIPVIRPGGGHAAPTEPPPE